MRIYYTRNLRQKSTGRHLSLIKLAPHSKRPAERRWQRKPAPSAETVESWIADGYGIGLRLGLQPNGAYLIAIDVDSEEGARWLRERGGVPLCPTILSARGHKYILKLPAGLRVSKITPAKGLEILGEGHQIVLPSPNAPDNRFWVITLEECGEIPEPHPWLIRLIRERQRADKRKSRGRSPAIKPAAARAKGEPISDHPPEQTRLGRALALFAQEILPYATAADSNHPRLLAGAIVAHRLDGLRDHDLINALEEINAQLPPDERENPRQLAAIARCTERRRYGFNARVYSERTGTPYEIARRVYEFVSVWERVEREPALMKREEFEHRLLKALQEHAHLSGDILVWWGTVERLATLAQVSPYTLRNRITRRDLPPLILAKTIIGREGGIILGIPLRLVREIALLICKSLILGEKSPVRLSSMYRGALGGKELWGEMVYDPRAGP